MENQTGTEVKGVEFNEEKYRVLMVALSQFANKFKELVFPDDPESLGDRMEILKKFREVSHFLQDMNLRRQLRENPNMIKMEGVPRVTVRDTKQAES